MFSAKWMKTNAVSRSDSMQLRDGEPTSLHTVNSDGSMFCCYVDKCAKRFHHQSQFTAHQIVHSFHTPQKETADFRDTSTCARCSSIRMIRSLLQRTKEHNQHTPLVPPPTIVHCEVDEVNCDDMNTSVTWNLLQPACHCKLGKCDKTTFSNAEILRDHCLCVHKANKHAEIFYCGYCPYACTDMPQAMIHSTQTHPIKSERNKPPQISPHGKQMKTAPSPIKPIRDKPCPKSKRLHLNLLVDTPPVADTPPTQVTPPDTVPTDYITFDVLEVEDKINKSPARQKPITNTNPGKLKIISKRDFSINDGSPLGLALKGPQLVPKRSSFTPPSLNHGDVIIMAGKVARIIKINKVYNNYQLKSLTLSL